MVAGGVEALRMMAADARVVARRPSVDTALVDIGVGVVAATRDVVSVRAVVTRVVFSRLVVVTHVGDVVAPFVLVVIVGFEEDFVGACICRLASTCPTARALDILKASLAGKR